jgi:hypothetical protein
MALEPIYNKNVYFNEQKCLLWSLQQDLNNKKSLK